MKRLFLLIFLVFNISVFMAQEKSVYVYRIDGRLNIYPFVDIDSIAYTNFEYNNKSQKNSLCQTIYSKIGICQIPLEIVDSVSFVTIEERVCPDSNHPHIIDLDLPSGTKWCCCNVGGTRPEDYGGYFAWGETAEKNIYDEKSYKYREYFNKVRNISGTSYDVATICMGKAWCMPTFEQQKELLLYCSWQWTHLNGVYGLLLSSRKGHGQLFMPAAGYFYGDKFFSGLGRWWSSQNTTKKGYALSYDYTMDSYGVADNLVKVYIGMSVRAVYK